MKTAEDLVFEIFGETDKFLTKEIEKYASQQVAAERERIKECIRAREIRVDPMFYLAYQDIYKIIDSL